MKKFVCVHGHFYQPPRENPWLEDVELQESAYPYHDWNERITAESYEPNTAARVVDSEFKIVDIVNNYSRISFNFGPTLLSWMEKHRPDVYKAILRADKDSMTRFSGHGSAIAQAYNHIIMPLASERDKKTQIKWGISDFRHRFGRMPEGMWLPETAVDNETLYFLASSGIKFTLLAPRQAKSIRRISSNNEKWMDPGEGGIDPRRPYFCNLKDGKKIVLFFYDGNIAHDVAFGNMLNSGEELAKRIVETLDEGGSPQIAHIATDGETFGHHQAYGEMTLAYALSSIESRRDAELTNYGEFIEKFDPEYEVEIYDNSSWSCVHGVERWRDSCGCNSGGHPGWHQNWRKPLREALIELRDKLADIFEEKASELLKDHWAARDRYISVILQRNESTLKAFFQEHSRKILSEEEKIVLLKLLEMQRFSMLMFTSCGWFFDELSGIETMQVIQYAARSLQLAKDLGEGHLEKAFIEALEKAPSNLPDERNGAFLYRKYIQNCMLDLVRVGAHFAISSFFEEYPEKTEIYCYEAKTDKLDRQQAGKHNLVCGRANIRSLVTTESEQIVFAVMHLGDHNIISGVTKYRTEKEFLKTVEDIKEAFNRTDISLTIDHVRKYFGEHNYTLWHLFKDDQRKVLDEILKDPVYDIETDMKKFKKQYYPVLKAVRQMRIPLPKPVKGLLNLIFNMDLANIMRQKSMEITELDELLEEMDLWGVDLDKENFAFVVNTKVNALMEKLEKFPGDASYIQKTEQILNRVQRLDIDYNFWKAKNIYFIMCKSILPEKEKKASKGDEVSKKWVESFKSLANPLNIKI